MDLFLDIRFGLRILSRAPFVTIFIALVLGLGVGANAAMFGVLNGLLLHAVPYPDAQALVFVSSIDAQGTLGLASAADFIDWRRRFKSLSDLAAWSSATFSFSGGERARHLRGARVSADFFRSLRTSPALGRTFLPDEDGLDNPAHAAHSVVIGYRVWQEELGADPNVLGRTVRIDSAPYTIVGVMPADFQFWRQPHELWIPVSLNPQDRDYRDLVVIARKDAPRNQIVHEADVIARSLGALYPKSDKGWTIRVEDLQDRLLKRTFRQRLVLLSGAVGLVLLITCTNIAGLLIAQSAARNRELAVRVSLGATGLRLARQLLTESALLAIGGGMLGVGTAWALIHAIPRFVPPRVIPPGTIEMSNSIVWFCLAASVLTCLLVGVAPAVSAAKTETQASLKDSGRGSTAGSGRKRLRELLVAGEVALALVLLSAAWLMTEGLRALTSGDPGFDAQNVLTARILLSPRENFSVYAVNFCREALDRLKGLPGVIDATVGTSLPLANSMMVRFDREDSRDESQQPSAPYAAIGPGYFGTLKIPIKRGRIFAESDNERSKLVAIISDALASRYFAGQDPIGKHMIVFRPVPPRGEEMAKVEIVGIVGDVNISNLSVDARPMIYVPYAQNPFTQVVQVALRTEGRTGQASSSLRREIMMINPEQPVEQPGSLEESLSAQFAQPRFETRLMGSFALLALLISVLGVYGVNTHSMTQRRKEIGIRLALGASRGSVLRHVAGKGFIPTAIGIGAGLLGASIAAWWLRSVLVGAGSIDPIAFAGAAFILGLVAGFACYLPARRAVRIDPAITLRSE